MASYIGIDLGTTFSCVATIDETGRPVIIDNPSISDGSNITPSCVMLKDAEMIVGEKARKAWGYSDNVFGRFKKDMGTSVTYTLAEDEFTPTSLSTLILSEMKKIAEQEVGDIAKAVVTIPANFEAEAREATMQAGIKAGLEIDFIINEPTAAALFYAYDSGTELSGNYIVYDLGGGTFDVSVINVSGQDIDVISSNGLRNLGGDDFDKALISMVQTNFKKETGKDLEDLDYTLNDAELDKISLSTRSKVIAGGENLIADDVVLHIKRSDFEKEISSLLAQTEMLCEATVSEAKLEIGDIEGVIIAGGSTRMPTVRESIKRIFGQNPLHSENVDEMVALGAALYAAYKSDRKELNSIQKESLNKIKVQESAGKYYGTLAIGYNEAKNEEELQNSILIEKGEKIPYSVTKSFLTRHDDQTILTATVTECGSLETDPNWVDIKWEGKLDLPPNRPKGQEIQVTYSYDASQMMHCEFKDVESGNIEKVDLEFGANDGDGESNIDKFLVD